MQRGSRGASWLRKNVWGSVNEASLSFERTVDRMLQLKYLVGTYCSFPVLFYWIAGNQKSWLMVEVCV